MAARAAARAGAGLTTIAVPEVALLGAIQSPCVMAPHDGKFKRIFDAGGDKLTRTRRLRH
jgi:NAD(P)H-hydrate epimerase